MKCYKCGETAGSMICRKCEREEAKKKLPKCSICREQFTEWGNNAEPVNKGTCCDKCNRDVVMPKRLEAIPF